ncbi:MAG TPA: hypothetical protein VF171_08460 [Trueperaceae bacterium]
MAGPARAQATWLVESLIPHVIAVRVPTTTLSFDLSHSDNYPPVTFPARYPLSQPDGGALPMQIFSNTDGFWSISLEIDDITDEDGALLIPASQILYRVNGGVWLRANSVPQVIFTGSGRTHGWQEIRVEFALELLGSERAGSYRVNATLTAQTQEF